MELKIFQVDAFADELFKGNPAAVIPINAWIDDVLMQNIAMENNLSETVFFVKSNDIYEIRWFTPSVEVDICGHATLASAFVLFNHLGYSSNKIIFHSHRSGELIVTREGELLTLNFPTDEITEVPISDEIRSCFNPMPVKAFRGRNDFMIVFSSETEIREMHPNFINLSKLYARGIIVTAKGDQIDFVSRFFGPQSGIDEDPVTGSAHTTLIPYWKEVLGKEVMDALQVSARGGKLTCKYLGERIEISGKASLYMVGTIFV
jgi:PhzF family phenazine biosynthesis protein